VWQHRWRLLAIVAVIVAPPVILAGLVTLLGR